MKTALARREPCTDATAKILIPGYESYRAEVFRRTRYHCSYCGADLLADLDAMATMCLDHVMPRGRGGPDHVSNLAPACTACDEIKAGRPARCVADGRRIIERQRTLLLPRFYALVAAHRDFLPTIHSYRVEPAGSGKETTRP